MTSLTQSLWGPKHLVLLSVLAPIPAICHHHQETRCNYLEIQEVGHICKKKYLGLDISMATDKPCNIYISLLSLYHI